MLKRGILFLLVFIMFSEINLAQENTCLFPSPGNAKLVAQRIFLTYSRLDLPEGITPQQAAIDSVERWQPEGEWAVYKEDIKSEIRNFYSEDPRLQNVLREYMQDDWKGIIQEDIPEILSLSEQTGVPAEAILAAILVEDLRYHGPDIVSRFSVSFLKSNFRKAIPNSVLTKFGHNPNAADGFSNYGTVLSITSSKFSVALTK